MSQQTVTKCDGKGCEKVKGEANKWICLRVIQVEGILEVAFGNYPAFNDGNYTSKYEDFCSDACLQKRIGEVINAIRNVPHIEAINTLKKQAIERDDRCVCGGVGCNSCEPQGRG